MKYDYSNLLSLDFNSIVNGLAEAMTIGKLIAFILVSMCITIFGIF